MFHMILLPLRQICYENHAGRTSSVIQEVEIIVQNVLLNFSRITTSSQCTECECHECDKTNFKINHKCNISNKRVSCWARYTWFYDSLLKENSNVDVLVVWRWFLSSATIKNTWKSLGHFPTNEIPLTEFLSSKNYFEVILMSANASW